MSVAAGIAQPDRSAGAPPVMDEIDQGRHRHPGRRSDDRQAPPRRAGKLAIDQFALHLEPDEQEEHRHQPVIDPQMDRHRPQRRGEHRAGFVVQQREIASREFGIGEDQRERRRRHQDDAARRLLPQEGAQRRTHLTQLYGRERKVGHRADPIAATAKRHRNRSVGERLGDQLARIVDAVERDEAPHARPLAKNQATFRIAPRTRRAAVRTRLRCRSHRRCSANRPPTHRPGQRQARDRAVRAPRSRFPPACGAGASARRNRGYTPAHGRSARRARSRHPRHRYSLLR